MSQGTPSPPTDEEVREVALSLQGYTVCVRGMCLARIGGEYVMRDGTWRCVRVPVQKADPALLGVMWAEFGRPESEWGRVSAADDVASIGAISSKHVAMVLQGYAGSTRGLCLARVVGNYVTRDGVRHCVRLLVDTVDPVALGAAWAAFSKVAGWLSPTSVERAETPDRSMALWHEPGERRRASG